MPAYPLVQLASEENFTELGYLAANPDVARAVREGRVESARKHFDVFGRKEGRKCRTPDTIRNAKARKLDRIRALLRTELPHRETSMLFDFLTGDLRDTFDIVETEAVSSNEYDANVMALIERHDAGILLDCGAGRRSIYYENVVNFEVVPYDTTDVLGVGEALPFRDEAFEAVISVAVLEHVKDPFRCAREIARVLKPGGDLYCAVPFLQPLHGYPHHYYNMTHQGLRNLFEDTLTIERIDVIQSVLPIWTLTWILRSWADGLQGAAREHFLSMQVRDLVSPAASYFGEDFVAQLSKEKNLELASANVLWARKA